MRTGMILITLLIVCHSTSFGQSVEDHVKRIREWYREVESKLASCKGVTTNNHLDEEFFDGYPPEISAWYDSTTGKFIKIQVSTAADWQEQTDYIYLKNNEVFFIYTKGYNGGEMYTAAELNLTEKELWERGGEAKTLDYYETRMYFVDRKVVRNLYKYKSFPVFEGQQYDLSNMENQDRPIAPDSQEPVLKYVERIMATLRKSL